MTVNSSTNVDLLTASKMPPAFNPEIFPEPSAPPLFEESAGNLSMITQGGAKAFKALEVSGKIILIGNSIKVAIENSDKIIPYVISPIRYAANALGYATIALTNVLSSSKGTFSIYNCINAISSQFSIFSSGSNMIMQEDPAYISTMLNIQTTLAITAVVSKGIEKTGSLLKSERISKIGKVGFWLAAAGFGVNTWQYLNKVYSSGK